MEAKFIKTGRVISGKAADLFIKLGLAEQIGDEDTTVEDQPKDDEQAEVVVKKEIRKNKKPAANKKRGRKPLKK